MPAVSGDALEIDELVVRYRFKRRYRYLWLAFSRLTKQVIAWIEGFNSKWRNRVSGLVQKNCLRAVFE